MAGRFHPRIVHTESINRFRGIHDPDQKHNLPQEYVEGMSNLPSMRIGEARTRQGQELLESYNNGVNTGASLIRNKVIGEGGNLWANALSRIVKHPIHDYEPPLNIVPPTIQKVIINPGDFVPPDPPDPPEPPEPEYSPFVTVWQTTGPNQTIGYKGDEDRTGFAGTISVYDHTTNTLISTNSYTGPQDAVLWPVMPSAGTYRIEILGNFPFIYSYYIENKTRLINVLSLGHINIDPLGLYSAFERCTSLVSCDFGDDDFSHITTLDYVFSKCSSIVHMPDFSGFSGVLSFEWAFYLCPSMSAFPSVSAMVNTVSAAGAWAFATSDTVPDVSALVKLENIEFAWEGNPNLIDGPDLSNLTSIKLMQESFWWCSSLTTVNIPTSINLLESAPGFLSDSDNVSHVSIDAILNRAHASLLANSGLPINVYIDLGDNKYTSAGQVAYNYLTNTAGWSIESGGLE